MMACRPFTLMQEIEKAFAEPVLKANDNAPHSDTDENEIEEESGHESEEDADSAHEDDSEERREEQKRGRSSFLTSNSGFKWSTDVPNGCRSQTVHKPAPKGDALDASTPLQAWSVLMTDDILNVIVTHTNEQIARALENRATVYTYEKDIDLIELKSLIGLLYYAGLHKLCHTSVNRLWSVHSMPLFLCVMPKQRFEFLMQNLRFDDKNTRAERKATDRFTHIREVWDMFIAKCNANYEPSSNCTIGEQLLSFRGRCSFKVYIRAKPDKYGLKIVTINDAETHYLFDAIPYCGRVNKDPTENLPSYYVRELTKSIYNSGRNITCDNWFTSIPICDKLRKDYGVTLVGKIRKNKSEIPQSFKKVPTDGSNARFAYNDGKVLVSYNPKPKKIVLLLSSLHVSGKIDKETGKPDIVLFYNKTKGGAVSFDQKCHNYTTARRSTSWPFRIFYGILDQASVNSCILFALHVENERLNRSEFILELAVSLVKPALARRLLMQTLSVSLRTKIEEFLEYRDMKEEDHPRDLFADNKMIKQKRCAYCPSNLDRKTYYKCLKCDSPMCRDHVAKICQKCTQ